MESKIHVIAEAGNNHNGDVATGKALIDVARNAGADSVKFQMIIPEGLYVPELVTSAGREPNPIIATRRKSMLTAAQYTELRDHCRAAGIQFSASVFDREGLDLLAKLDAPYIKIASTDLNNVRLLRQAAALGRRLVVSTGLSTLQDVERAVATIAAAGNPPLVLLHCVSVYPAATRLMNLAFIDTLRDAFGVEVGLSDHTESDVVAAAAVAKGVTWIEKHFTLDRTQEGFDHGYAMEPDAFATYVRSIRDVEAALQPREHKLSEPEMNVQARARRGIYYARDVKAGETLGPDDVTVVRPPSAFGAEAIDAVVGRTITRDRSRFEPVAPTDF